MGPVPRRYGLGSSSNGEGGWFGYTAVQPPSTPTTAEYIAAVRRAANRLGGAASDSIVGLGRRYRQVTVALTNTESAWVRPTMGGESAWINVLAEGLADALTAADDIFWARRMLHETTLVGLDTAPGGPTLARRFAVDGIEEFLALAGPTRRPSPVRIVLAAALHRLVWDATWDAHGLHVTRRQFPVDDAAGWSMDCADWAPDLSRADLRISGQAADVWTLLWRPSGPADWVITVGDAQILDALHAAATAAVAGTALPSPPT